MRTPRGSHQTFAWLQTSRVRLRRFQTNTATRRGSFQRPFRKKSCVARSLDTSWSALRNYSYTLNSFKFIGSNNLSSLLGLMKSVWDQWSNLAEVLALGFVRGYETRERQPCFKVRKVPSGSFALFCFTPHGTFFTFSRQTEQPLPHVCSILSL